MTDYLLYWYRALSDRFDRRTLAAAPRLLRIVLALAARPVVFLVGTWAALAWLAVTGRVELAVAATAVIAVQTSLAALSQLVIYGAAMFHTSLYLADMRSFLDLAAALCPQARRVEAIEQVGKSGSTRSSTSTRARMSPAVDDVSLTLRRGEIVAMVGENGCGKSTLMRLVTGILLADKGVVTWDGADLAGADPHSVWARTGLVPQDFAQWPLRVRENVTLGQPRTANDDLVWESLDAVGMRGPVADLPHGLDTLLARELFGGVELSGGQFQRVACSRALYRGPAVLVMDEPTSQMDVRGERDMFDAIRAIAAGRITLMVTHNLENTKVADRIVVMEHGRITEQGPYDELAHGGGLFAELLAISKDR